MTAMRELRRPLQQRFRWAVRMAATTVAAVVVLGIPAGAATAASAATAPVAPAPPARPVVAARAQSAVAAPDRPASAVGPSPSSPSAPLRLARTGVSVRGATTTSARASSRALGGLTAQLAQARRPEGLLGQWVVGVLLSILVVLWVVLVAIVVRAHMRFAQSAGRSPSEDGHMK
ncbi:MAG: hypothetical protein ACYCSX_06375 [Acidimicrobiales bacterium]